MLDYIKKLITPDMVSLWVPSGQNRAIDLIRGNHGQCYGTHPNVPVISPPIDQISACDAETDWTGTDLSIDTSDKKEGTGSLKDTVAVPVATTTYITQYNPAGSWDWSAKKHILFWLKSDRASTAFTDATLYIVDTSSNYSYWNLTFSAGEWTAIKELLSTRDGGSATPLDLALVSHIFVRFKAADTTAFYKKIDDIRVTGKPSLINPSVGWVFDGVDDYVDLGTPASLNIVDEITIGVWAKSDTVEGIHALLSRHTGEPDASGTLRLSSSIVQVIINIGGVFPGAFQTSSVIETGKYYYLVYTYNGSVEKIYVNAVERATRNNSGVIYTPTPGNIIGRAILPANYCECAIALPFIANKGWSQQQVNNFYLNTKGLFAPRG